MARGSPRAIVRAVFIYALNLFCWTFIAALAFYCPSRRPIHIQGPATVSVVAESDNCGTYTAFIFLLDKKLSRHH